MKAISMPMLHVSTSRDPSEPLTLSSEISATNNGMIMKIPAPPKPDNILAA